MMIVGLIGPSGHIAARYDSVMTARRGTVCAAATRAGIGTAVAAVLLAGCALTESTMSGRGMQPMTGPEVQAVMSKARYRWEAAAGATGTAMTSGDGRIRVIWATGAVNGRIRFTKTGYCSRFDGVRGGAEDCYRLYRTAPREYAVFKEDGTHSGKIEVLD